MSTRNILIAVAVIALIAIALNWKKLFNGMPAGGRVRNGARALNGGDYPEPQPTPVRPTIIVTAPLTNVVQEMAKRVEAETANTRITSDGKYNLLNEKLASYGMWVKPDGTNPPSGNLIKCCTKASIFPAGPINGLDAYWSTNCNSAPVRGSC